MTRMRYSIRSILALILVTAFGLGVWTWYRYRAQRREVAIAALTSAPYPTGIDFNPASLVRSVNQLHSLGKQDVLLALHEFEEAYPNRGYSSPHQSLGLVIPLLFDRKNPEDKYPRFRDSSDPTKGIELSEDSWRYWIVIEDGIPFHTVYIAGTSGSAGSRNYLIEWANDHARLRDTPMTPGELFPAAERVMRRVGVGKNDKASLYWTIQHIRMQVFRSVEQSLDLPEDDDSLTPYDEERWLLLWQRCDELGIVWSKELQAFKATRDSSRRY
jgi:hypothetical protein